MGEPVLIARHCRFLFRPPAGFCGGVLHWLVSDLDVGSAREMGPAYFPLMVSLVLAAMGLILMAKGVLVARTFGSRF